MDIIVTTPKSEIENSKREGEALTNPNDYWFRTFKFKPKCEPGDKIYFVESSFIKGYGIIFEISEISSGVKCDVTDREWDGKFVIKYRNWNWLDKPIPFKGFQGIRYVQGDIKDKLKERDIISCSAKLIMKNK